MAEAVRILFLECPEEKALACLRELRRAGYVPEYRHIETLGQLQEALGGAGWDIAIAEDFAGLSVNREALLMLHDAQANVPLLVLSTQRHGPNGIAGLPADAGIITTVEQPGDLPIAMERVWRKAEGQRERRRAKAALEEKNRMLDNLLSCLPGMVYRCRSDELGTFEFASDASYDLTGYDAAELIHSRKAAMRDLIHPDDREDIMRRKMSVAADRKQFTLIYRIISAHGKVKWVHDRGHGIHTPAGELSAIEGFLTDITAYKQSAQALAEERDMLKVTLRAIGEGVIATDAFGRVAFMNKAAEEFTQCSFAEAAGRRLPEIIPALHLKAQADSVAILQNILGAEVEIIAQTFACFENHKTITDRQGNKRIIAISGTPIHDPHDRVIGAVLIMSDITEKREVEEEHIRLSKLHSLGLLAGGIAHNFNNKLAVVLGNINLAKLNLPQKHDDIQEYLTLAEHAASEIADLTQQLLTFSPGGTPIKRLVHIHDLLRRAVANALRTTRWTAKLHVPETLWPVEGDEGQLNHAFSSLVASLAFTNTKGGGMELTAENCSTPKTGDRQIRLTLTATGANVSREHLDHLFDPYFFAQNWQNGMGLAICHSIIQKHNGHIATELADHAVVFKIELPAALEAEKTEPPETDHEIRPGKGQILLMEDEKPLSDIFTTMLERLGYTVAISVADGHAAVQAYKQALKRGQTIDLAILDMTVPGGMGGLETIRELRKLNSQLKAVICSGYINDAVMTNYAHYGFQGRLCKPFKLHEVSRLLDQLLNAK